MEIEKYCSELRKSPLFRQASEATLKCALEQSELFVYRTGEEIKIQGHLAFLLSGSACVYSTDRRRQLLLRRIKSGEVFGVAGLFSGDNPISLVYSKGISQILFFDERTVRYMLESDSAFMYGYISFLNGRISYLNKKITHLTAGSAERKLAVFLDSFGDDRLELPVNLSAASDMLNIGRASLYRALDRMAADGCIERNGNNITILDRKMMLEKY